VLAPQIGLLCSITVVSPNDIKDHFAGVPTPSFIAPRPTPLSSEYVCESRTEIHVSIDLIFR
jgi:hypothetical protein